MQCQIQVVFVFFQIQAGWQLVILAARIYEKCFSHHCALVPQTITAEWDGAIPRRENSSACMPSNVLTCMQVGKKRKTDAESSTALVWGAYYYTEFTHHKTIYSDTFRQSYKQNWENERSHSDAVKMKFSICINMHHSIINLWRGSWDPFILNLLFFFFSVTASWICETQSSLLPNTFAFRQTHSPRPQLQPHVIQLKASERQRL